MSGKSVRQSRLARCERCNAVSSVQVIGKQIVKVNGKGCQCEEADLSLLGPSEVIDQE